MVYLPRCTQGWEGQYCPLPDKRETSSRPENDLSIYREDEHALEKCYEYACNAQCNKYWPVEFDVMYKMAQSNFRLRNAHVNTSGE